MTLINQTIAFAVAFVATAFLVACGSDSASDASADRLQVVATTTVLEDVARVLAGPDAEVTGIMRVGEDPHVYEVRPQDAVTLSKADLVLANGFHLEATLGGVIRQVAPDTHIDLGEAAGITPLGSDVYAGAPDPHIWMDAALFAKAVVVAGEAMAKADPPHADNYTRRAADYVAELMKVDEDIRTALEAVPRDQRIIITSHDAFNYYARAYGVEVHGVVGISTDAQPTGQQVEALRALVKNRGVKALFVETSTSPTLNNIVQKVAAESGVAIGGTLYSDSLGDPGTPGGTYLGMLRHNTDVIVAALSSAKKSAAP